MNKIHTTSVVIRYHFLGNDTISFSDKHMGPHGWRLATIFNFSVKMFKAANVNNSIFRFWLFVIYPVKIQREANIKYNFIDHCGGKYCSKLYNVLRV